jgi:hypothetical protein
VGGDGDGADDNSSDSTEHPCLKERRKSAKRHLPGRRPPVAEPVSDSSSDESISDEEEGEQRGGRGGTVNREEIGTLFGGFDLPVPYDVDNPFSRVRMLHGRTSHYARVAHGYRQYHVSHHGYNVFNCITLTPVCANKCIHLYPVSVIQG